MAADPTCPESDSTSNASSDTKCVTENKRQTNNEVEKSTKSKKNEIYVYKPILERVLQFALIAETIWVPYIYKDEPMTIVTLLGLCFGVHGFVSCCKALSFHAGRYVSTFCYRVGMVEHRPLHSRAQLLKWQDQVWQFAIHVSMTLFEIYCLSGETWWDDMWTVWDPIPIEAYKTIKPSLKLFYLTQMAIWVYTCYMHALEPMRNRRKDYYVMFSHHVVTIALIAGSASCWTYRMGMIVLYVHDCSDIFIDLLKLTNYLKIDGRKGFFLVELSFVAAFVSWIYYRLYLYPFYVLDAAFWGGHTVAGGTDYPGEPWKDPFPPNISFWPQGNILLFVLAIMHVYWFYTLSKILFKILFATSREASRSEYEGHSSSEEENEVRDRPELAKMKQKKAVKDTTDTGKTIASQSLRKRQLA